MKNFIKGFIIGIGKVIPGVSGAILAIIMGIYDKALFYINNFKNNKKEAIRFLLPIGVGIILAIILFSKIIDYALTKYYLITMLFFVGLVVGGIPFVYNKVEKKDYFIVVVSFMVFFVVSITNVSNNYIVSNNFVDAIIFVISGFIEAIGTVVPGISSTALLLIMGTYDTIISSIGNLTDFSLFIFNLKILIPYGIGVVIGIILIVRLVNFLFDRYNNKMYAFIFGVLLSSIVLLIIKTFNTEFVVVELVVGIFMMFFGILISSLLETLELNILTSSAVLEFAKTAAVILIEPSKVISSR